MGLLEELKGKRESAAGDALGEMEIPEGFVKWEGGECPVDPQATVDVLYRNGDRPYKVTGAVADALDWSGTGWLPNGDAWDIIAYRVLPIEPAAEAKGEDGFTREGETEAIEAALTHFHGGTSFSDLDTDTITIASSSQHAEESARAQSLPPLFKPEPPQPATPESLEATGVIDSEASWWARKLAKEPA